MIQIPASKVKPAHTDVDIDFSDRDKALAGLDYVKGSRRQGNNMLLHNTGVYFQNIPVDPLTDLASIDAKAAENRGYFKIDFLNVSLYDGVRNEEHLIELMNREPRWELLEYEEFVEELWQIGNHAKLLNEKKPTSIVELSMILAIIRPAKSHLKKLSWVEIEKTVWNKPTLGEKGYKYKDSMFKKSHAVAYSVGIVVQMNLIIEQLGEGDE